MLKFYRQEFSFNTHIVNSLFTKFTILFTIRTPQSEKYESNFASYYSERILNHSDLIRDQRVNHMLSSLLKIIFPLGSLCEGL